MNAHERLLAEGPRVAPEPSVAADASSAMARHQRAVPKSLRRLAGPAVVVIVIAANSIGVDAVASYLALAVVGVFVVVSLLGRVR